MMASAGPMVPAPYRVRRVQQETADTWTLDLEPEDDVGAPAFKPGQFNMLYAFGVGEVPISISGDPTAPGRLIHTVRAVGPVSRALCAVRPGTTVGVRGPFGTAWPVTNGGGRDVLLVAGGVGLAPLRPAFYQVLAQRPRYGRVALLYGARSPENLLFAAELARWRARFDVEVHITVDHAIAEWNGHVGVVTALLEYARMDPDDCLALLCGPEIMMRLVSNDLLRRGVTADRIFVSLERNMQCGVGLCGHCQLGPELTCRDGPVYPLQQVESLLHVREL